MKLKPPGLDEAAPGKRSWSEQAVFGCNNSDYKRCNLHIFQLLYANSKDQKPHDAPALNLQKKWALMIVTSKLHAFFEYIQQ